MAWPSSHPRGLSLDTSLSFPNDAAPRAPSHSCPSSSLSSSSSPSLYVTFKVLQLVNSFRKRVQTRVRAARPPAKKAESKQSSEGDFCEAFERQAFDEIDRYLGRKSKHPNNPRRRGAVDNLPKRRRGQSNASKPVRLADQDERSATSKSIEHLIGQINRSVTSEPHPLATVAAKEQLFITRKAEFTFEKERLSLNELVHLLVEIKDLLRSLTQFAPTRPGVKTLCEGNELLDLTLDETYIANLEHLLHCLRDQVLRLVVQKLVEVFHQHLVECQRDQSRHSDDWFFEFPDARHPLSTTWPWSIKPSLAVLWGVCWMFYEPSPHASIWDSLNENLDMVNERGEIVLPREMVETILRQRQAAYNHHPSPVPGTTQRQGLVTTSPQPDALSPSSARPGWGMAAPQYASATVTSAAAALASTAVQSLPYTTAAAAPSLYATPDAAQWLPQQPTYSAALGFSDGTYPADAAGNPWATSLPAHSVGAQQQQQQPGFDFRDPSHLPPRPSRHPLTPTIRVTTDFSTFPPGFQQQPQDVYASATSASSNNSSFALQETQNPSPFYPQPTYTGHLSPQDTRFMAQDQQEMATPPRSPLHANFEGQPTRKRSHSVMSGGAPPQQQPQPGVNSRSGSVVSMQPQSPADDMSPIYHSGGRPEPPKNADGKYYCDFSADCQGLTFDRRCEWSKHKDKHIRPYRCVHPGCAKLQGFTYSGGLLRHEREVHGKHGGPRAQLMCPHEDCKRHTGKGFTRKENLSEHIRRVHQNREAPSPTVPYKRDAVGEVLAGADEAETPASRTSEMVDSADAISPALKRRRYPGDPHESAEVESLRQEMEALRQQNDALAQRNAHLEEAMRQLQHTQVEGQE